MRLSASRIRSINRAIARVQSSAWSVQREPTATRPSTGASQPINQPKFVRVVVVPRSKAA